MCCFINIKGSRLRSLMATDGGLHPPQSHLHLNRKKKSRSIFFNKANITSFVLAFRTRFPLIESMICNRFSSGREAHSISRFVACINLNGCTTESFPGFVFSLYFNFKSFSLARLLRKWVEYEPKGRR